MIQFTTTDKLRQALEFHNISLSDYKPAYGGESAGLDLYNAGPRVVIPYVDDDLTPINERLSTFIPTGIRIVIPKGHVGLILERGSITKTSLKVRAGVVDPSYSGEIFINCVALSKPGLQYLPYDKLPFQLVITTAYTNYCHIEQDAFVEAHKFSQRKENCIGSSDKS